MGNCLWSVHFESDYSSIILCRSDDWVLIYVSHLRFLFNFQFPSFRIFGRSVISILQFRFPEIKTFFSIGRKTVFFVAIIIQILSGIGMATVPYWPLFMLFRAAAGCSHPGNVFIIYNIFPEILPQNSISRDFCHRSDHRNGTSWAVEAENCCYRSWNLLCFRRNYVGWISVFDKGLSYSSNGCCIARNFLPSILVVMNEVN